MALTWRYAAAVGTNNGDETSHTHSAVPIGAAAADRWVVVIIGVARNSATAITSVTIGGVAATAHPENASTIPAGSDGSYVYWANVPSGTTADIVISYNGTTWNGHAGIWTVDGEPTFHDRQRDTTPTLGDYNPIYDGNDQHYSVVIDVPEGGSLIAQSHVVGLNYAVWSGATERWENLVYEGNSGADADGLSAQTGRTVSVTFNGVAIEDYLDVVTFTASGGGGAQSLTPTLFASVAAFGAAVVTAGAVALSPAAYANGDSFGSATIAAGPVSLSPAAFSDGDAFGGASVAAGAVALVPPRLVDGDSFGAAAVSPGTVTLTAARYADADAFGAHSAAPGAVAITAALVVDTDAFGAATVSQGSAGGQSLAAGLFADADTFAAPVVSVGPVALVASRLVDADAFGAHSVASLVTLAATVHLDADAFGASTIAPGAVTLGPAIHADADTFGGASVAAGHLPGRIAYPAASLNGGTLGPSANGGALAQPQNGGALAASERGGRILNPSNGGTLIEG